MANFNTAYGLCPIIDQTGLLGVSGDEEGCAIVTVGKNMVIRCRLSDQKQVNSWSTTLAKLTSKVVCNGETYTGVFDKVYIKQWNKFESSLEKVKKCKLASQVHEIVLYKTHNKSKVELLVVFENGSSINLDSALKNRKISLPGILHSEDSIKSVHIINAGGKNYLIIISNFANKYKVCYSACLHPDSSQVDIESVKKTKLRRQGFFLLGQCMLESEKGNVLLTFWSDGFVYSLPLPLQSDRDSIGKFIGTINAIGKKSEIAVLAVSSSHVAMYAADPSEEGALLAIYNVTFGMMQATTKFKMFNKPPKMWLINNSLVIVMGQRLVCVPFKLQTESLSALVGSRPIFADVKAPSDICTVIPTETWESDDVIDDPMRDDFPSKIYPQLSAFSSEGFSESGICQSLLTQLIEAKDVSSLRWCLQNFIDIPEELLVKLVSLSLTESNSVFEKLELEEQNSRTPASNKAEVRLVNGLSETSDSSPLEPDSRRQFLNKVLTIPMNSVTLLTNIRSGLKFEEGLSLLEYLCYLVSVRNDLSDVNLFNWTIVLIDAFYQQFILSRDTRVLEMILVLKEKIDLTISALNEIKKLVPIVMRLKKGKEIFKKQGHSKNYCVERFKLYQ